MVKYELPKLAYGYDELEPHIDALTMEIHHTKHHQSYTDGLNKTLEKISGQSHPKYISSILVEIQSVPLEHQNAINFFGGGYENHKQFWENMIPTGGGAPGGKIADAIDIYFNSFDNFKKQFSENAITLQGSGWSWLVFNETYSKLELVTTENQTSPWTQRKVPILGLDVWEHAYYLKYQNKKPDYVSAWWNVVNWEAIDSRFSKIC